MHHFCPQHGKNWAVVTETIVEKALYPAFNIVEAWED
jgi:hypothetical protein